MTRRAIENISVKARNLPALRQVGQVIYRKRFRRGPWLR
jgi:hypothetical protein